MTSGREYVSKQFKPSHLRSEWNFCDVIFKTKRNAHKRKVLAARPSSAEVSKPLTKRAKSDSSLRKSDSSSLQMSDSSSLRKSDSFLKRSDSSLRKSDRSSNQVSESSSSLQKSDSSSLRKSVSPSLLKSEICLQMSDSSSLRKSDSSLQKSDSSSTSKGSLMMSEDRREDNVDNVENVDPTQNIPFKMTTLLSGFTAGRWVFRQLIKQKAKDLDLSFSAGSRSENNKEHGFSNACPQAQLTNSAKLRKLIEAEDRVIQDDEAEDRVIQDVEAEDRVIKVEAGERSTSLCPLCGSAQPHLDKYNKPTLVLTVCPEYRRLEAEARREALIRLKACFLCFAPGHDTQKCRDELFSVMTMLKY